MFKRIEIWILYVVILVMLLAMIAFGVLVRQGIEGRTSVGGFSIEPVTDPIVTFVRGPEQILRHILKPNKMRVNDPWNEQKSYWDLRGFTGEKHKEKAYLLLSRYDGDLEESVVELVDLRSFKVRHRWNPDIDQLNALVSKDNPEFKGLHRDLREKRYAIRHPFLTEGGGLLIHDTSPLVKIDYCSNFVWQNQKDRYHHSIEKDAEGNYWVPSHLYPYAVDEKYVGSKPGTYNDDSMVKLSPAGEVLFTKSVSELFYENHMGHRLHGLGSESFYSDPIHLNDIQPVTKNGPFWEKGDVFISLRNQSMVLLYRPRTDEILWKGEGHFTYQHDIDILDDHRVSILDNNLKFYPKVEVDGHSRLVIYNFKTNAYSVYKDAVLDRLDVSTPYQGVAKIRPNGDVFFEETVNGRMVYIQEEKLKWQYVNSASDGNVYRMGWSRIFFKPSNVQRIHDILNDKGCEND